MTDPNFTPKLPTPEANRPVLTLPASGTSSGGADASPELFSRDQGMPTEEIRVGCFDIEYAKELIAKKRRLKFENRLSEPAYYAGSGKISRKLCRILVSFGLLKEAVDVDLFKGDRHEH